MYTNETNIPLPLALWLATDNYEHSDDPDVISASTLVKSVRKIVHSIWAEKAGVGSGDISGLLASRIGTAIHESIERSWFDPKEALEKLSIDPKVIEALLINPKPEDVTSDNIPVYMELRTKKDVAGKVVSGCLDLCMNGELCDYKTTGTYAHGKLGKERDYIIQGSIYRWLNPELVTKDEMHIYHIYKDWNANKALGSSTYPQSPIFDLRLKLMSLEETEAYIIKKITDVYKMVDFEEASLPLCDTIDLWMDPPTYSYYAKEDSLRATKNFGTDAAAAHAHAAAKGKGLVKERPSVPKACNYCPAINCSQKNNFIASGILK